jgi:small subunit ribosomal protein S9
VGDEERDTTAPAPEPREGDTIVAGPEFVPETAVAVGEAPEPGREPAYGTGRRKTSIARVFLRSGAGRVLVNGKPLAQYFSSPKWRKQAREPLEFLGVADRYDASITVRGGGSGGQAGAVRMGLSRALALAQPSLRVKLRQNGFLTRDPRMKERKKYGQKGARKRFQWTKR